MEQIGRNHKDDANISSSSSDGATGDEVAVYDCSLFKQVAIISSYDKA